VLPSQGDFVRIFIVTIQLTLQTNPGIQTANTIIYCRRWEKTVRFYRDVFGLRIQLANDWSVEFCLNDRARLSIANEKRAAKKSSGGQGITLALETEDIEAFHAFLKNAGLALPEIKDHPWEARVFYMRDPEGNRVKIWQPHCATGKARSQH